MTCTPPKLPSAIPTDACARLAYIEDALLQLATGAKRASVRQGDNWVTYHIGSVAFLERERNRLATICNGRHAITVGGPPLASSYGHRRRP